MTQRQLFILSFFTFFILILLQLIGIFRLFLTPILWAVILALIFYPLYTSVLTLCRGRRNVSSLLVSLLVVIVTVGPMVFFSGALVREILEFYGKVGAWIAEKRYEVIWNRLLDSPLRFLWDKVVEKTATLDIQIVPLLGKAAHNLSQAVVGTIQEGTKNFLVFVINYLVTIVITFFFLRDGHSLARGLKDLFPMTKENKEMVFERLATTVSAVVRGLVVTGVVQGLLAGIAFWVLGVPYPIFLASIIAFFAVLPIGGAVLVWFPSSLYLFFSGMWIKALLLFLWGALVVSTVDNFLKPLLIGEKTKIPTLFLFFAILGGIFFYGMIGVFLGPVMLALFLTLVEIYRKEYPES